MKKKTKTIKAWAIVRSDDCLIDSNLDLDTYLLKLGEILKKVEYEPIYSPAVFYNKRQAEKYLKRLTFLECKVRLAPIEIKILK